MIFGYIRVSTDKQTVENQRFEIIKYSKQHHMKIDEWIEETISGTVSPSKRNLGVLLKKTKQNDIIICSELSRLGRTMFMIMSILNLLMERGVQIYTVKEGYKLGEDLICQYLSEGFPKTYICSRLNVSNSTLYSFMRRTKIYIPDKK